MLLNGNYKDLMNVKQYNTNRFVYMCIYKIIPINLQVELAFQKITLPSGTHRITCNCVTYILS